MSHAIIHARRLARQWRPAPWGRLLSGLLVALAAVGLALSKGLLHVALVVLTFYLLHLLLPGVTIELVP